MWAASTSTARATWRWEIKIERSWAARRPGCARTSKQFAGYRARVLQRKLLIRSPRIPNASSSRLSQPSHAREQRERFVQVIDRGRDVLEPERADRVLGVLLRVRDVRGGDAVRERLRRRRRRRRRRRDSRRRRRRRRPRAARGRRRARTHRGGGWGCRRGCRSGCRRRRRRRRGGRRRRRFLSTAASCTAAAAGCAAAARRPRGARALVLPLFRRRRRGPPLSVRLRELPRAPRRVPLLPRHLVAELVLRAVAHVELRVVPRDATRRMKVGAEFEGVGSDGVERRRGGASGS